METALKNTMVQYGDLEFYIYYFIHDNDINPESGFLNLTLGSEDDEFEKITSIVPNSILDNEEDQIKTVQKMVTEYFESIRKPT
jgi:hypothetical protein